MISVVSAMGSTGRPLVELSVNGRTTLCFIDTGSEATLVKSSAAILMDTSHRPRSRSSSKILRGVTGQPLHVTSELTLPFHLDDDLTVSHQVAEADISFPGDILIGMDLLRRLDFALSHCATTNKAVLVLEGRSFAVVYTDHQSLGVCPVTSTDILSSTQKVASVGAEINKEKVPLIDQGQKPRVEAAVHLIQRTEIPPHSGCFLHGCVARTGPTNGDILVTPAVAEALNLPYSITTVKERQCQVWAVNPSSRPLILHNGTRLGTAEYIEAVYATDSSDLPPQDPPVEPAARTSNNAFEEGSQGGDMLEDVEFEWEDDDFDSFYGVQDFGCSDLDILDAELPPSSALATIEAAESLGSKAFGDNSDHLSLNLAHLEEDQRLELTGLLSRYKDLFDGDEGTVGLVPGIKHKIETGDANPVCNRQWRLPQSTRQTIKEQCDSMLHAGVIEPSTSPWLSPVVLVKKKGGTLRFCVDYRGLNAVTKRDAYPLPHISEMIDELGPMNIFTTLDARAAYWSVEVEESDRPKTAFSDGYRLFQFRRLPFGLSTAPTTFQRTMNLVLSSVLGRHTLAYLDDVIVYSRSFSQHLKDLDETLQLLTMAGLKLNLQKCQFAATTIDFLGFTISPEGVSPNREKVVAISKTPPPRTVREVRRFLGATGFFRKHIPGYATIASPLHLLLKKGQAWSWGPKQQAAFNTLKEKLT